MSRKNGSIRGGRRRNKNDDTCIKNTDDDRRIRSACKGINSTYTQDTIRMYTNIKFYKGDSVEVGIPLKRK